VVSYAEGVSEVTQQGVNYMSDKNDYWKEIFEDNLDDVGVSPLDNAVEDADTFQIDEAFFASDEDYKLLRPPVSDTNVIPPEVRDVSAYTNGHSKGADAFDEGGNTDEDEDDYQFDASIFDLEDRDDEAFEDDDPYEEDDMEDDRPPKGEEPSVQLVRRRRTGLMGGVMYAAVIISVSIILASVAWMVADDVLALTKEEVTVEVIIPDNFTIGDVAEELYAAGAINFRPLFTWFAYFSSAEDRIQPGQYQLTIADYRAIINRLNQRTGELIEQRVMIPEGRTMREIFQILEDNGVSTVEALEEAAATTEVDFEFLQDIPMNTMNRLEGYLFPDTYVFYLRQDPVRVINRMLQNFHTRMLQNDIYDLVEESEFTLHEIINIAAMIEKEMASVAEAPTISSVIHNRLNVPMMLQIDATIQYILGDDRREVLHADDRWIDSPYNTYVVDGLPYGPIGNPGVASILAALQPARTNYLFYALHIDGHHEFFPNYERHLAFQQTPNFAHYGRF